MQYFLEYRVIPPERRDCTFIDFSHDLSQLIHEHRTQVSALANDLGISTSGTGDDLVNEDVPGNIKLHILRSTLALISELEKGLKQWSIKTLEELHGHEDIIDMSTDEDGRLVTVCEEYIPRLRYWLRRLCQLNQEINQPFEQDMGDWSMYSSLPN